MTTPPGAAPDLSRLLDPRGVAVIGASTDLSRIGGQPIKLLTEYGYRGKVYPVNPKYTEVKGLRCYPDVTAVPKPCDIALIAVAGHLVPGAIEQCGKAGIPFAVVLSAGFGEAGESGRELNDKLLAAVKTSGVRIVGPNCLGLMNLDADFRLGFGGTLQLKTLKPGPIAMVTQSGGFGFGVVAVACYYGLGFNHVISTGNEADLTALDWMEHLIERPDVEILTAFLEGTTEGERLRRLGARALELGKPVLIWKVGNTDVGSKAATSHTARLTAGYELFRTAFREGGFIEVQDVDDLVDYCKAFRARKLPKGRGVGVMTLSGGAGVLLADRCVARGLALPRLADATREKLRGIVVAYASIENPIDTTAQGYNDNFASYTKTMREVLADPNIDAIVARAPRGSVAQAWAEGLVEMLKTTGKPLLLNWPTSPDDNRGAMDYLESHGVPCILAPGRTVDALAALNDFAAKKREFEARRARGGKRAIAPQKLDPKGSGTLGEHASKALLRAYGIPVTGEKLLAPDTVEKLAAAPLPFPLAVKIESADIPHKTEAGVIRLNITSLDGLKQAAREVLAAAQAYKADARIDGILVQQMAAGEEVIAGAVNDPHFGPLIAVGLGGVFTEIMHDVTHRYAPFDAETAKAMIHEIRGVKLLQGYRGRPACNIDALADALSRLSLLAADHADRIAEIDINPLFVNAEGVVAADALIVLKN
ncbi:MAG: acetate--CoA ligase family protein [Burkholderiales bacterium]|nr:acetate--CoA ligase family protein [Burkholderiales bacterium]